MDALLPKPWLYGETLRHLEPKPDAKIKVIGAGLPRTGTNSFIAALSYLLNGPGYHVGVQTAMTANAQHFLRWIEVMRLRTSNKPSTQSRERILRILESELDGYVAVTDPPASQLIPELMEIYPDAIVMCTVRDKDSWLKSMESIAKVARPGLFDVLFFWIRSLRHFSEAMRLMGKTFEAVYGRAGDNEEDLRYVWDKHIAWLKEIVPEDKLFFVNVKDGWKPMCDALEMEVPKDKEFPRLNDAKALEGAFTNWAIQGLMSWGAALGVFGVVGGLGMWVDWRR